MKLALLAIAAAAALALTGSAFADQTYTDSTGEVANSADISTVAVSNNPTAGTLTFVVTTNLAALDDNSFFGIIIDSDLNASTGVGGFDYLIGMDNTGAASINLATKAALPEPQSSFAGGVWTITVPTIDVGDPSTSFNFGVFTDVGPDPNNPIEDDAPDNGIWTYTMVQPPPPPPPPPPVLTVSSVSVAAAGTPHHGRAFHIAGLTVDLSNGTETKATGVKCTATLGGKHLAGTGTGGCTFHLPATATGKKLVVKVTGKYKSTTVTKTARYTVK